MVKSDAVSEIIRFQRTFQSLWAMARYGAGDPFWQDAYAWPGAD